MRSIGVLACAIVASAAVRAMAAPAGYFELGPDVLLESGDTWSRNGVRYRLYGVQSCLRGTSFTNRYGRTEDCGEASLSVLAAFVKDTKPVCAPIVKSGSVTYVMCFASVAGKHLDLGMMLICEGYVFAALDTAGMPVDPSYAVAEQQARVNQAGLWQFSGIQHPAIVLGRAAGRQGSRQ